MRCRTAFLASTVAILLLANARAMNHSGWQATGSASARRLAAFALADAQP